MVHHQKPRVSSYSLPAGEFRGLEWAGTNGTAVFLHGLSGVADVWSGTIAALGDRVALVAAARFPERFSSVAILDIGPEAWKKNSPPPPGCSRNSATRSPIVTPRSHCSALLVRGGDSRELRARVADAMRHRNPTVAFVEIADTGHNLPLLAPQRLDRELCQFWDCAEAAQR